MGVKDITQKAFFTDNKRFADLMNAVCFAGRKIIKPEELISVSEYVRRADEVAILERVCDVVKKQTRDGSIYAIYALENQETVDYRMLVRIMLEESLGYDAQIKQIAKQNNECLECDAEASGKKVAKKTVTAGEYLYGFCKTDRLTPIYTIVVHWGAGKWDGATSLRELVDIKETDEELRNTLLSLLPDYKIKVFDLNSEQDFSAFGTTLRTIFEFYSKHNDGVAMREYMDSHHEEVKRLDEESRFFLSKMLGTRKWKNELVLKTEKTNENNAERDSKEEEKDMCKAIEELIEMGRQEGIEQGMEQAKKEMREKILLLEQEIERLRQQQIPQS